MLQREGVRQGKMSSVCLSVCPPVFLDIHPNRPQFFSGETVTLSCGGLQDSAGWTLKRTDVYLRTKPCGGGFGRVDGSSCVVSDLSSLDSGSYWCEDGDGQRSDELRVFVSGTETDSWLFVSLLSVSSVTVSLCPRPSLVQIT